MTAEQTAGFKEIIVRIDERVESLLGKQEEHTKQLVSIKDEVNSISNRVSLLEKLEDSTVKELSQTVTELSKRVVVLEVAGPAIVQNHTFSINDIVSRLMILEKDSKNFLGNWQLIVSAVIQVVTLVTVAFIAYKLGLK